ncbi:MAG TPA: S8 family serine peptidase [Steroidobacteraceae bacterium]|jgi:subtilisin family serine protease|nr:S8 family serine peptidase [Steroidobacteraceae bacterium]
MSRSHNPSPADWTHIGPGRAFRGCVAAALAALALLSPHFATAAPPEVRTPEEVRTQPDQFIVVAVANPVTGRPAAVGGTAHGYGSSSNYRISASANNLVRELARNHSLTLVSEWPIEQLQMHCVLFRIPPGTTREAVIEKLLQDKRVLIAQPLNEFESATSASPAFDDPYARLQSNVSALDVAEAHNISRGSGVRVAIIDTGVDIGHPDLAGRTQLTRNYIDDDERLFRNDRHGTQIAGLIAASANNGIGIVGVAPDVKLLAFKACWQASPTSAGRCNSFTLAQALADALAARAHIINLSLVGPSDPLLEALVARAIDGGIIVVGAVSQDPRFGFPARLPRVLPVAEAETSPDDRTGILRAPARDIVTLVPNGHYDFASGSSLATAQISGVVALLLAKNQKLGVERLRALLEQSTEKHDTTRGPFLSVNACAALVQVVRGAVCRTP